MIPQYCPEQQQKNISLEHKHLKQTLGLTVFGDIGWDKILVILVYLNIQVAKIQQHSEDHQLWNNINDKEIEHVVEPEWFLMIKMSEGVSMRGNEAVLSISLGGRCCQKRRVGVVFCKSHFYHSFPSPGQQHKK